MRLRLLSTLWLCGLLMLATGSVAAAERVISKEVIVAAPIAEVWRSWTTREGIESFFAPEAVVEARPGGAFHIHIDPLAQPGSKGADDMRFMALQPPTMLSFDWNAPPSLPEVRKQRTFVVIRLASVDGDRTRVSLQHSGWGDGGEWDKAFGYFDRAWGAVLTNLQKRFDKGPIDWTDWLQMLQRMHAPPPAPAASTPR